MGSYVSESLFSSLCVCPFTGVVMRNPVIADDGITYEENNISTWIRTYGVSPVSGKTIGLNFRINRALKDLIEEEASRLPEPERERAFSVPIARIRLIVSMHWLTGMKFSDPELPSTIPFGDSDWPLQINRSRCVELTWDAFPALRFMVYKEFSAVVDGVSDSDVVSDSAKQKAKRFFVWSMNAHMHDSKNKQLIFALRECLRVMYSDFMRYEADMPETWRRFWR